MNNRQNIGLNRPGRVDEIIKVELSGKHLGLRLALVLLLILLGAAAIAYGFLQLLSSGSGWTEITANSASQVGCTDQFIFQYCLGASGTDATTESKTLKALYTDTCIHAQQLFTTDSGDGANVFDDDSGDGANVFDDSSAGTNVLTDNPTDIMGGASVLNLYHINHHPNEILTIEAPLYHAFEEIEATGNRAIYLGPVYAYYENLFTCNTEEETLSFDPWQNDEIADFYQKIADFANNPSSIQMDLQGNNQICLTISQEYLDYAKTEGIDRFIDFSWMRNAFIVDYLAETMIESGYTYGTISSYDGFSRCLDENPDHSYSQNLFNLYEGKVEKAATMNYNGRLASCYLRTYPMNVQDTYHYYEMSDGQIRTIYLSTEDGKCHNREPNLVSWAHGDKGCAEVLLKMMPVFVDGSKTLGELHEEGINSAWFDGLQLNCDDVEVRLE